MIKAIEGIINYLRLLQYLRHNTVQVLHLQWLPFLEICSIEKYILKYLRKHYQHLKIILTIHNIYPHNSTPKRQAEYRQRMMGVMPFISHFITHTQNSRHTINEEFGLPLNRISVIHHGIFMPDKFPNRKREDNKIRILLFGQQSGYKGTDLLIEAIEQLPKVYHQKVETRIIGTTSKELIEAYFERAQQIGVIWQNEFIKDEQLYQEIQNADILVYPYRAISQSGALLLGIAFRKIIILSDLPSFKETMGNSYPSTLFFHNGSAEGLTTTICQCIDQYDEYKTRVMPILQSIIEENSWENAADKTITLYNQ